MRYSTPQFYVFLFLFLLNLGVGQVAAQKNKTIDSLSAKLLAYERDKQTSKIVAADTVKATILFGFVKYYLESDPVKALDYANQLLRLSEKLQYQPGIANANISLGSLYDLRSEYNKALRHYQRSLEINQKIGNKIGVIDSYYNIGALFGKQSNYNESLNYTLKGLATATSSHDDFGMAGGYNNLGVLYKSIGNYPEALKAYLKCIATMRRMKDFSAVAIAYNNIAEIFLLQGKPDVSLAYHVLGLKAAKASGNQQAEGDIFHGMGNANLKKGLYDKARQNYLVSLKIRSAIGDSYGIADSHINIGNIHYKEHHYSAAIAEVNQGLSLAEKANEKDLMLQAYKLLSMIYDASKNFEMAYKSHLRFKQLTDSLFNAEKNQKFVQLKMQYEFKVIRDSLKAAQDRKDLRAQAAIKEQKSTRNFIIIIMGLVVLFLVNFIWQRNKISLVNKQKAIEEERNRISRDLHDNLGAQLSTVRMFLSNIKNKKGDQISEAVDNSVELLDNSINDLRGLMEAINNSLLVEKGYLAATEALINKLSPLKAVHFTLTHHKLHERPALQIEKELFRITQELVNNTLKYAKATHVTIDLVRRDGKLILVYEDDGIGYEPSHVQTGYGMRNVASRVQSVGGSLSVDSQPGSGTSIIIEIPWT